MAIRKTAGYAWNLISLVGVILAIVATGAIIAFIALEMITEFDNPYLGIVTNFILPGMLIFGLLLVPFGAWRVREKRRLHPEADIAPFPKLDLNEPHNRHLVIFFAVATSLFVVLVAVSGIKGFEFTESTTFCGELCHVVMSPEHTAWSNSPHAKVKCVECHVGPGAAWFVKAKISGLRQVWAVATHSFPTPIHTPIENLRPARDTCEHCHWPEKFYSGRQKVFHHFAPNEENTPRETNLLIKIGGTPKSPHAMGIHWHIGTEVHFIARDRQRFEIPYIAVKEKDGSITEYMSTETPLTKDEIAKAKKRLMDCTDCHNRPTHIYKSPSQEMDEHLISGSIDSKLPYVKKISVELLEKPYKNKEEAEKALAAGITDYYQKNYPALAKQKADAIAAAIKQVQDIYSRNYFPEMKVKWNTYPNHIGHFYTPGCFRCHDGKHKTAAGKVISKDCNLCHTVISQTQENIPAGKQVKDFVHPV
ncbi:MAG TPA: NapC/NirT family cytochrome c, partial [Verrucomicrobiae bacterium]|nr:NapC/NirT family cytochrome c [Verrucomicrobiae bacterium]